MPALAAAAVGVLAALALRGAPPRDCGARGVVCGGACSRARAALASELVGQAQAAEALAAAACDHLPAVRPYSRRRPLALSVHGPPGVGKSLAHALLAGALYNASEGADCPGSACPAYRVVFGADYTAQEREVQLVALRNALTGHLSRHPQALVVIEEYDKMDCAVRGVVRSLLDGGLTTTARGRYASSGGGGGVGEAALAEAFVGAAGAPAAQVSFADAIFVLESNVGYLEIYGDAEAQAANGSAALSAELYDRKLKDAVFGAWLRQGCESRVDSQRLLGLIDAFVPFAPLGRAHLEALAAKRLEARAARERALGRFELSWARGELEAHLASRAEYDADGGWAIEGAKEMDTIFSRHVSRPLRAWADARGIAEADAAAEAEADTARWRRRALEEAVAGALQVVTAAGREALHAAGALPPAGEEPSTGDAVTAGRNTVAPQEPLPHVRLEVVNGRVRAVDDDA